MCRHQIFPVLGGEEIDAEKLLDFCRRRDFRIHPGNDVTASHPDSTKIESGTRVAASGEGGSAVLERGSGGITGEWCYFSVDLSCVGLFCNSKVVQRLQVKPRLCIPAEVAR